MEINRSGVTIFNPEYRLIQVLCERHRIEKRDEGDVDVVTKPTAYFNCDEDAHTYAAKAVMQGDKVIGFFDRSKGTKEITRLLYIGTDGAIVEGANQEDPQ